MQAISKKTLAIFFLSFLFAAAGGLIWDYIQQTPFREICQEAAQETANSGNYSESKKVYDECLKSFKD